MIMLSDKKPGFKFILLLTHQAVIDPGKLTLNPTMEVDGSDDFPSQLGDFSVPCYFSGVYVWVRRTNGIGPFWGRNSLPTWGP